MCRSAVERLAEAGQAVGSLMRGWRTGLDAEADVIPGFGVRATVDLAWWCELAVEAACRRLP